jgi:mRNA-degrading endonuclease RelE of RelBE toxin-antitoxin system
MSAASTPLALSVEPRFHNELVSLPRDAQKKVIRALSELQEDPARLSKPLQGMAPVWRRKVDPYRILFVKQPGWIHVYSVQHRQGVYSGTIATPTVTPQQPLTTAPAELPDELREPESPIAPLIDERVLRNENLDDDLTEGILTCQTEEELSGLIDIGLPEHLFDMLAHELAVRSTRTQADLWTVRLVRRHVIDDFFGRLILLPTTTPVVDLTIVSPWITPWEGRSSSLEAIVKRAQQLRIPTTIVTRPPTLANHKLAMERLSTIRTAEIVHLKDLHAKFFICDIAPIPLTLLGSANATTQSIANFELGVLVRGSGQAEGFVRELQSLTTELRSFGQRIKRRGDA